MARRVGLAVVLGLLTLPAAVRAQYGGGYGAPPPPQAMPMAPAFNPMMTPEWQQAGGNYQAWEQLMLQKMAAQEQAAFQQQAQAYQAWAKANPKEAAALEKAYKAQMNPNMAAGAARRKKATAKSLAAAKGAKPAAAVKGAKPAAKPQEDADEEEIEPKPAATPKAAAAKPAAPAAPAATSTPKSSRQGTPKTAAPK